MGGVFNTVNLHVYHYTGNNPIKYTDPTGESDILEFLNSKSNYSPFQQRIDNILKDISKTKFGKTLEGQAVVKSLRELNDMGRIVVGDLNKEKSSGNNVWGYWDSERDIIILDKTIVNELDLALPGILVHEGTHRNDKKTKGLPYTLSSEKRAFTNQYAYTKETNPELARILSIPSDEELRENYPSIPDDL